MSNGRDLENASSGPSPEQGGRRAAPEIAIKVRDLVVGFGDKLVMQGLDLNVYRGEVSGFVGGSGTGKSVLTRTILGLVRKRSGLIEIFGSDLDSLSPRERTAIERRIGVMFQQGALFSGLTVKQNVEVPMREHLRLSQRVADELEFEHSEFFRKAGR